MQTLEDTLMTDLELIMAATWKLLTIWWPLLIPIVGYAVWETITEQRPRGPQKRSKPAPARVPTQLR